jgi:peroxiredoxin
MRFARIAGATVGIVVAALLAVVAVALPIGGGPPQIGSAAPSGSRAPVGGSGPPSDASTTPRATLAETLRPPSPTPVPQTGIDVGQLAPDFDLRSPEGETIRLSDFRGRPVWINFWAPWCPACRTEMPRLEGFYLEHRDDDLVILGVGVRDSPESMRAYAGEVGVTYPIVVDGDGAVANVYRALALPVHYWIDRDGIVRDWAFGELPPDLLAASLQSILTPPPAQ